ncbi:MAG: hypothetical protein HY918_05460 [Candidatus Doudnabacteria bacterium]|nr:hypothetical protein [Candidatus Doudnabacteria bacterium]
MQFNEDKLIEIAKPYFNRARAGDWNHAVRVVKWVKELGKGRADLDTLVTAAYLHDVGWSSVAPKDKLNLDEMLLLENQANKNSSIKVKEVLGQCAFASIDINSVIRLIGAADKHSSEKEDEAIIVDADSLSKLCIEHLQEKYQKNSFIKVLKLWDDELKTRVKTEKAKELFPKLLIDLKGKLI